MLEILIFVGLFIINPLLAFLVLGLWLFLIFRNEIKKEQEECKRLWEHLQQKEDHK